ncbi:MAG: DNA/RNA nuclease SfsA [Candidatus Electryonea clarkiae]|nr:DNA/RNA nuclease SfsA [Candidatus Electryonea clarkiae]MDP8288978.1 DNA/RNA nuclease SfsA [Candidatus Electryonea clarkiae]
MLYPSKLIEGRLIRRYKRFLADVIVSGEKMTVHCPNTGSMSGLLEEGNPVLISGPHNPKRKYLYTLEQIRIKRPDGRRIWVGVNTAVPNRVVSEAVSEKLLPGLEGYSSFRSEVSIGDHSRIDLLLDSDNLQPCWIEVKNVTMVLPNPNVKSNFNEGNFACFPDAVTTRGRKHLQVLCDQIDEGDRAMMVYVVQRSDGEIFAPASGFDPEYADELKGSVDRGLEVLAVQANVTPKAVKIFQTIPVRN